jgi:hypothetical protein
MRTWYFPNSNELLQKGQNGKKAHIKGWSSHCQSQKHMSSKTSTKQKHIWGMPEHLQHKAQYSHLCRCMELEKQVSNGG